MTNPIIWHSPALEKPKADQVVMGKSTSRIALCKYNRQTNQWITLDGKIINVYMWRKDGDS